MGYCERTRCVRASGVLVGLMLLGTMSVAAQPKMAFPTTVSDGLRGPVEVVMQTATYATGDGDYAVSTSEVWMYDTNGRATKYITMSQDGLNGSLSYTHYADGRPKLCVTAGGDEARSENYVYSGDGRLVRVEAHYADGNERVYGVIEYDAQGRAISLLDTAYGLHIYSFRYDDSERVVFAEDSSMATLNRSYYGAYGIDSTNFLGHNIVYHYNEQGHLVAREWRGSGGKEVYQIMTTDKYGNWTSRKVTLLDGTELYEDRIILYYNVS